MQAGETPSVDELWAMLQDQREEIARLKARLEQKNAGNGLRDGGPAIVGSSEHGGTSRCLSRAGLFKVAAAGAAGLAAIDLNGATGVTPAFASTTDTNFYAVGGSGIGVEAGGGSSFTSNSTYTTGVAGTGSICGVYGEANNPDNNQAVPTSGQYGVFGRTTDPTGGGVAVRAVAAGNGTGVYATSSTGAGVAGESNGSPGVQGFSYANLGQGVHGQCRSTDGTGYGVFGRVDHSDGTIGIGYGVYGESGAVGVGGADTGTSGGNGVLGTSVNGTGVKGTSSGSGGKGLDGTCSSSDGSGYGVHGRSEYSGGAIGIGFGVYGESGSGVGVGGQATSGTGVQGLATTTGTGVYGLGSSDNLGTGVLGEVRDQGGNLSVGYAVKGNAGNGIGVQGNATGGYGVNGIATTGIGGVFSGGTAPLRLVPSSSGGAPASGRHSRGEIHVDNAGTLFHCIADGSPGMWVPLISLVPFSSPHRVFGDGTVTPAGTTTAAVDATTGGVPAGARAAYCAVQATAQGVMTLFPDGASDPGIANWANTGNSGQLALFYMLVPLSSAGKFKIHTYLTGQIYVDVWGYLL